ncbi:hypothetical protein K2Z83_03715 [Oscillochloris sp. ZM17-4]|uniref:hypothetical protein n=1 Tax=Oscillochloris sp. ZM17-4 TaxID=2866714 RepID=UPI001C7382A1|nr:hypothetical protein [Oscillochloris sp. ZM17-4]MBX0326788.1 hypothetical protein [Oscillochloris sp. ZM17-4]
MDRRYAEAAIMGLAIGLGAILLEVWVGHAGWPARIAALVVIGAVICAAQYGLMRWRKIR